MKLADHTALRNLDEKEVKATIQDGDWVCFDSQCHAVDRTSTSWYIVLDGQKFWAFVNNGRVTSTTLLRS